VFAVVSVFVFVFVFAFERIFVVDFVRVVFCVWVGGWSGISIS